MGQEESTMSITERPQSMKPTTKPKKTSSKISESKSLIISYNSYSFQLLIPDDTLTCGWLLSEVIRGLSEYDQSLSSQIVSLSTGKAKALDCWLLMYDRPLTPFKNNDKIVPILSEPVSEPMTVANFKPIKVIGKGGF